MLETLEEKGIEPRLAASIGFMSKMTGKPDHLVSALLVKSTQAAYWITCPAQMALNVAEAFDTIISANPASYPGSSDALKKRVQKQEAFYEGCV